MRFFICSTILMYFILIGPVWAGDAPTLQHDPCINDSKACRMLAVEVAKLDFSDFITTKLDSRQSNNFLCPADKPQCCPKHLMPLCLEIKKDVVIEARQKFQDGLDSFFCEAGGGHFNELTKICGKDIDIVFDPPFPPWEVCECNEENNPKGICVPKKICWSPGSMFRMPCSLACTENAGTVFKPSNPSNLGRHLSDTQVQLEAAKQVSEDLKAALGVLDEEIKKLSTQYEKK